MFQPKPHLHSRREILRQIAGASLSLPFARVLPALGQTNPQQKTAASPASPATPARPANPALSPEDDQFLHEVESASFLFFWEQGSPNTGMVQDRCNVRENRPGGASSIAATGFGLTALCIGVQRGFIPASAALERVFATLRFLWKKLPNHRGFFYHFANPETG